MDIEQLKLILETAQAAGEGAYSIALIWLGIGLLKFILEAGVIGGGIYAAYRVAYGVVKNTIFKEKVRGIIGFIETDNTTEMTKFLCWLEERNAENSWYDTRTKPMRSR